MRCVNLFYAKIWNKYSFDCKFAETQNGKIMIKNLIITFLVLLMPYSVYSQSRIEISGLKGGELRSSKKLTVDTAQYRVVYEVKFIRNPKVPEKITTGRTLLLQGKHSALYKDFYEVLSDSVREEALRQGTSQVEAINKALAVTGQKFREEIVQDYPERGKALVQEYFMAGTKRYVDDGAVQEWALHDEAMDILGYHCQKATCRYRGRDYEAWYTEEIPIYRGPYLFAGLPGLIIKIRDSSGEYDFSMIGFEKVDNPFPLTIYDDKGIENLSRDDFRFLKAYKYENPSAALMAGGSIKLNLTPEEEKELEKRLNSPRPYNPIERE